MKVALVQMGAGENKPANLHKAVHMVRTAINRRAKFILLPELFVFRGRVSSPEVRRNISERIPGASIKPFMDLAKRHRVFILAGSVYERIPQSNKVYNASVLINDCGRVQARYRKINLFDAVLGKKQLKESRYFKAGKQGVTAKIGSYTVGMSVCYDLRFPQLYRSYAQKGAHVLCVPSAFTKKTGQAHWKVLLRARAIENLCYILAPNQIGRDFRGVESYGHSMIINSWGEVLAEGSADKEEIIYGEIDLKKILECRAILPAIRSK